MHEVVDLLAYRVVFTIIPPNRQYLPVILRNRHHIRQFNARWLAILVHILMAQQVQINVALQQSTVVIDL